MFQLFLVFVLAHLMADFIFQRSNIIELKKTNFHKGLLRHVFCHFVLSLAGVLSYYFVNEDWSLSVVIKSLIAVLAITVGHYFIDWLKETVKKKYDHVFVSGSLFVFDQLLHLILILLILNVLGMVTYSMEQWNRDIVQFLFEGIEFTNVTKLLLILNLLILSTEGAGYFLGIVLKNLGPNPTLNKGTYSITDEKTEIKTLFNEKGEEVNEVTTIKTEQFYKDSPKNIGRYIGMIERLLIIIFIVQGFPHGLPFLIAIKSLTRFKQFENKQFSEYYLIGSLFSALIAVVIGYLVLRIL
ncbi:DUF3307 domain-containing protein [Alkalihalobacillus sp. AL-G]|uniref:DUF3307 domain-containing protein n=1 Tax=Alkalihalobacillus sp. AL-G TaxID=2926399 RepID=UPI00272B62E9|nr:DUF3307 domain-containing protein [Alkalihalobacillus sp. AL-G]WLD91606.1 DUF3307 domain-containing protein [Alkalihalobacillus sp. AL-G]